MAFDGFRWHVRAFCHVDRAFKDFLLPRILGVRGTGAPEASAKDDTDWQRTIVFQIGPHPGLTPAQRKAIELDYGMAKGVVEIEVRAAFAYYARKRLGLDRPPEHLRPQDQQIVLLKAMPGPTAELRLVGRRKTVEIR
jgi:predicted DNA-binding transcriptional regulator YafY